MTIEQANVTPVLRDSTVETVTLKNLVALDIVEQNEAVLHAFQLLDDSATRTTLPITRTKESVLEMIEKKKQELQSAIDDVKNAKVDRSNSDSTLLAQLGAEFLKDEVAVDNTDELLAAFEKENEIKIVEKKDGADYRFVNGEKLKALVEKVQSETKKDSDGDVEITQ